MKNGAQQRPQQNKTFPTQQGRQKCRTLYTTSRNCGAL